jgi:futalosine hydrolase
VRRLLVVTAAAAERDAVLTGRAPTIGMLDGMEVHRALTPAGLLDVIATGVGPVTAALSTARALRSGYDLVISSGIAGGFTSVDIMGVVVATAVVHADLGAETADGFASMADLGWGPIRFELEQAIVAEFVHRTDAIAGAILTVSTVCGSQTRAEELQVAHPDAVAEAMEGVGSYLAASQAGTPYAELRTISNRVGPRIRDQWRVAEALNALTRAFDALLASPLPTTPRDQR